MKKYFKITAFIVSSAATLLQCNIGKVENANLVNDTTTLLAPETSAAIAENNADEITLTTNDSAMYISPIYSFNETQEYYTPLFRLKDSPDETFFEDLERELDSVIYQGDEERRTRLPIEVAQKNFNLLGLDHITIYNKYGNPVTEAKLVRVEYHDSMIEGGYIAVFKGLDPFRIAEEVGYCTSSGHNIFEAYQFDWRTINDSNLSKKLVKHFELDSQQVWRITHTFFPDENVTYSTIAVDHRGSLLVETRDGRFTVLYTLGYNYSFTDLLPVHFKYNGHPVLLAGMAPNESDGHSVGLIAYSDGEYKILPGCRAQF